MLGNNAPHPKQVDTWAWGKETIIWGGNPSDKYTFKVLEPKKGKDGMLSLQYHHQKCETWFQLRGISWALMIIDDQVCTRLMRPGDIQNLPTGIIHRIMAVTDDCQILEPSTPDAHAADKNVPKDIVRLHCVFGRPVSPARTQKEQELIEKSILLSIQACEAVEKSTLPLEQNLDLIFGISGFSLNG